MRIVSLAAALAAITVITPVAGAATPETGEVSASKITESWSGEAYGQPMKFGGFTQTHQFCIDPFCDSFTLTVKDPGHLKVVLNAPGSAGYVDVLVTMPDGTTEFLEGTEAETVQEIVYKTAAVGAYSFDIWPNEIYGVYDGYFTGDAELCPAPQPFSECFLPPEEEVFE